MNLSGKTWALAAEKKTRKELQQSARCVQNSPELHYSNQCRRANTGEKQLKRFRQRCGEERGV